MAIYKDIEIPDVLTGILNHMSEVEGYREELSALGQRWDLLTILGQMTGGETDMTDTREGFRSLTGQLLGALGMETLKKTVQEMTLKAQVTVDIVIRNLFERTADIGFLATDEDIRNYLAAVKNGQAGEEQRSEIVARFREYVAKYSVYQNILLLDNQGQVVAQLDEENPVEASEDPAIGRAQQTINDYVETFGYSDLNPREETSLLYSYRVTASSAADSEKLGVLCLCFRFHDELQGVFDNLRRDGDTSVLLLLDEQGKTIATSDKYQVPLDAPMELVTEDEFRVVRFAGRAYIAKTCPTTGYQGYRGLGWSGHVLIPLHLAFQTNLEQTATVDPKILNAILSDPRLFSPKLRQIPKDASRIQGDLDRTVWNGNVRQGSQGNDSMAARVLLWEISKTGERTKNVFERSIGNLHQTIVSSILSDVEFSASLAVDLMDRNLYERANDCRWWALTGAFRRLLAQPALSAAETETISSILLAINSLYTVYTNLFVYDNSGKILAVSNPGAENLVGRQLDEEWVRQTLCIRDSQRYSVSPFAETELYGNHHTYVYGASITDLSNTHRVVGGIGLVFDSTPQFRAMLMDSLPNDSSGEVVSGSFAVFLERDGKVISSTLPEVKPGSQFQAREEFLTLKEGERRGQIVEFEGTYYAVGGECSNGYREFKSETDTYRNDVISLAFIPLGKVELASKPVGPSATVSNTDGRSSLPPGQEGIEVATFFVGEQWLGLRTDSVVEAVSYGSVTKIPGANDYLLGTTLFRGQPVPVFSVHGDFGMKPPSSAETAQIVVVDIEGSRAGLVVDALGEIPEVATHRIDSDNALLQNAASYIEGIVTPEGDDIDVSLLMLMDLTELRNRIFPVRAGV